MEFCGILWNFLQGEKVEVEFLKFHKIPQNSTKVPCLQWEFYVVSISPPASKGESDVACLIIVCVAFLATSRNESKVPQ